MKTLNVKDKSDYFLSNIGDSCPNLLYINDIDLSL